MNNLSLRCITRVLLSHSFLFLSEKMVCACPNRLSWVRKMLFTMFPAVCYPKIAILLQSHHAGF